MFLQEDRVGDENASLSFILGSDRGFLSDLQKIDFCSVTKVALHFFTARGCGGCFICVSEAQIRGAVQILIRHEIYYMGLKD